MKNFLQPRGCHHGTASPAEWAFPRLLLPPKAPLNTLARQSLRTSLRTMMRRRSCSGGAPGFFDLQFSTDSPTLAGLLRQVSKTRLPRVAATASWAALRLHHQARHLCGFLGLDSQRPTSFCFSFEMLKFQLQCPSLRTHRY